MRKENTNKVGIIMKRLVIGILAHVDAGKTTLVESMLYSTGNIRTLGRVDHKNAFLDTYDLERDRGITIFSKQAQINIEDTEISLLDTPGHVDFSSEMERTLQVLDYAILVISARDGIQGHTETLWKLLDTYKIPTFLFINKMDMPDTNKDNLLEELKERLSDNCLDFTVDHKNEEFLEHLAMCDEDLLNKYFELGSLNRADISKAIKKRSIFPCYFGSALKLEGVDTFIKGLKEFTKANIYPKDFGAKVFKIARDDSGNRLTFMKITGGSIKVKMPLSDKNNTWEEKIDQIRIYSGAKYQTVDGLKAGSICAVTGLTKTFPGEGLGIERTIKKPLLEPVLNYQIILPSSCNINEMLSNLRQLEEEDPQLQIVWNEKLKEIHVKLMGEVQVEIYKSLIKEKFGVDVEFGTGNIVYKETIEEAVVGVGHFEPLGHYAEVHLLLEPGKRGSGITWESNCSEDILDINWQKLILTHIQEKEHIGVLTGSPITDIKITLLTGRAHQNHTEGGDFRQATYRAIRQGLKKAKSILLEPYYNFRMEIPQGNLGRAMTDIQYMHGRFYPPKTKGDMAELSGYVPVSTLGDYQTQLNSYTSGRGRMMLTLKGYEPCHNSNEVIANIGYDSEADLDNPTASIFCSHGAGFIVKWDEVEDYMHLNNEWTKEKDKELNVKIVEQQTKQVKKSSYRGTLEEDKELESIFTRTYGPIERKLHTSRNMFGYENDGYGKRKSKGHKKGKSSDLDNYDADQQNKWDLKKKRDHRKNFLLVDGYNIIFAWDELKDLANANLAAARLKLADILSNYQGYRKNTIILVFDAYKVEGGKGESMDYKNIHVVFTKEAETADMYIEKVTRDIAKKHNVVVATSDRVEQMIILGQGAMRLSADELLEEVEFVRQEIRTNYLNKAPKKMNSIGEQFADELDKFTRDE